MPARRIGKEEAPSESSMWSVKIRLVQHSLFDTWGWRARTESLGRPTRRAYGSHEPSPLEGQMQSRSTLSAPRGSLSMRSSRFRSLWMNSFWNTKPSEWEAITSM